jgi:hypothetical protein
MKAWEETWTSVLWMHDHNQDPLYNVEAGDDDLVADAMGNKGRVDLIVAAPEMARMLLSAATPGHGDYVCIPRANIEAVLRKAGVIADKETRHDG